MAYNAFSFTIDSKMVPKIRQMKDRVAKLFNVQVEFKEVFLNQLQWISLEDGYLTDEDSLYIEAKEYILALVEPEITFCQDNVRLSQQMRDDIEKKSAARLMEKNGTVSIQGTQMNVGMAKSLLDSMVAENVDSLPKRHKAKVDHEGGHQFDNDQTHVIGRTPPAPDLTRLGARVQPDVAPPSYANHQTPEELGGDCVSQESYLRNLGRTSGFSEIEMDVAFSQFEDDVIKPLEFMAALNHLRFLNTECREASKRDAPSQKTPPAVGSSPSVPTSSAVNNTVALSRHRPAPSYHTPVPSTHPSAPSNRPLAPSSRTPAPFNHLFASFDRPLPLPSSSLHSSGLKHEEGLRDRMSSMSTALPLVRSPVSESQLRYIIIDGSNVAMSHGRNKMFSVKGIRICLEYFLERGHEVIAFVPESRRYKRNPIPIDDKQMLDQLNEDNFINFTPARRIEGKVIACYDDRFILNLAIERRGIVVSNDQFRDLIDAKPGYRDVIINRLLSYTFVGDTFMPPDDPLGARGPLLDEFLQMPRPEDVARSRQLHRPSCGRGRSADRWRHR